MLRRIVLGAGSLAKSQWRVFRLYLDAIEEVGRIERRLFEVRDPKSLALLTCARDAARAAWLNLPAEWRAKLEPPERDDPFCD